ncbi:MAG: hypothetical protein ACLGI6_17210 [Gammaproteobacteria bacterium]
MRSARQWPIILGLVTGIAAAAAVVAFTPKPDGRQQVEFLTAFYRDYLDRQARSPMAAASFYSTGARALIANNAALCRRLARADEKCGYAVDGDEFLDAMEVAPGLTLTAARFRAAPAGPNTVDVSFTVQPGSGEAGERRIRYMLVKEEGGWRVDDALFGDAAGFSAQRSLRHQIEEENGQVLANARDLTEVARWVSTFLNEVDMVERAARYASDPVQVCGKDGICAAVKRDAPALHAALRELHRAYHRDAPASATDLGECVPSQVAPVDGKAVAVDSLEFTFREQAWWISRIDLAGLERHPSRGCGRAGR